MSSKYMYREYDALALRSKADRQQALVKHIRKADKRKKGDEVVFDPRAHKDFVTGFRRRKQQRRKDAIKQMEQQHRDERVEERKERRTKMKAQLGLPDNYGLESSGSSSGSELDEGDLASHRRAQVRVFRSGGTTTTVSVVPVGVGSESDADEDEDEAAHASPSGGQARGRVGVRDLGLPRQHLRERGDATGSGAGTGAGAGAGSRKAHKQQVHDREELLRRQHSQQTLYRLKNKQKQGGKGRGSKGRTSAKAGKKRKR